MTKSSLLIALALTLVCNSAFADDKKINDPLLARAISSFEKRKETADKVLEKAKERHAQDLAGATKSLIFAVDAAIKRATRQGLLVKAQAMLAMKKKLEAGSDAPHISKGSGKSVVGVIHVCGNDGFDLRINGEAVVSGGLESKKPIDGRLRPGDVITAKVQNENGHKGFMFLFESADKKNVFLTNAHTWKAYTPHDPLKWWEITKQTKVTPAKRTDKIYMTLGAGAGLGVESIWGNEGAVAYVLHVVTASDLKNK